MKIVQLDVLEYTTDAAACARMEKRTPFVLRGLDIGPCSSKWKNEDYLLSHIGDKKIVAHVADTGNLDFLGKNFAYREMPFSEFFRRSKEENSTEFLYLRAVADDARHKVAKLEADFPGIASDFATPSSIPSDRLFSSVLRMGSEGVRVWLHYDVMDNILVQVVGRKKIYLFPPSDLPNMYLQGDKSKVVDFDAPDVDRFSNLSRATRFEAILEPADSVFIPALWFHTTQHLTYSIGVNVFWRFLDEKLYDPKDLYGNRDPLPARDAMQRVILCAASPPYRFQGLDKALQKINNFEDSQHRVFFALKMIETLNAYVDKNKV